MARHRKSKQFRRIVIAAVAVAAVGVPSAAMACVDWPGSGTGGSTPKAAHTLSADWRDQFLWNRVWDGDNDTPTATATPKTTSAADAASHRAKTKTHKPKAAATPGHGTRTPHVPWTAPPASAAPAPAHTPAATGTPESPAAPEPANTPKPTATPSATATATAATARVVELVNAERSKVGCSPLTVNATLTKAAQAHSADMAAHQNMSHTGSDGSAPGDRITRAGYIWNTYGENVAFGYAGPEQVMAGWMGSPGHKANILNCSFKEIGVGLAEPGSYWTQDFGTAR
ncbi:CAP domain-containing protein [Streptomyces sp. NPDC059766]|uniref:CAP domain-containing protein n=1 Tax=Streptomyces sp. NPDC059766 TaxID=3346940 RepID=UPI003669FC83